MGFKCFYVNRDTSLATVDVRFDDCFQRNSTEPHPDKLENAYFGVGKFALEPGRENLLEKKGLLLATAEAPVDKFFARYSPFLQRINVFYSQDILWAVL